MCQYVCHFKPQLFLIMYYMNKTHGHKVIFLKDSHLYAKMSYQLRGLPCVNCCAAQFGKVAGYFYGSDIGICQIDAF